LRLSHSMSNLKELTSTLSQIDLPERGDWVRLVYMSGDRLYTSAD
jgi:hypothetical protein